MQTRGHGHHGQLFPILCFGLIAVLSVGSATVPPPRPVRAAQPGLGDRTHDMDAMVAAAPRSAPELALRFEALLGQHSELAADFMRGRIRGDDDFAQAANAALGKNTDAMTQLMGSLFGTATAKKFRPLWAEHIVELFTYARGLADSDDAMRRDARTELAEYEEDLGSFFTAASHGRLSRDTANRAMRTHVDHLLMQADAYAARDYPTADRIYREGYQHTYDLGGTVAAALLPAKEAAALQAPLWRLRSHLGRLLSEHVVLLEDVTRAAITNTPDFDAAAQSVNGNTRDLAAAMDSLFGAAAAKDFQSLWANHIEQLVTYASATATQDSAVRERTRTKLHDFEVRMAAFLGTATGKRLSSGSLADALQAHDQMLLRHTDTFAAKDYATAHEIAYQTYENMFELARQLAQAFGATVASRLPVGGPQTGYGGMADAVERR